MGPVAFNDGTSPESTAMDWMISQDRDRTSTLSDDALVERFAPVSISFGLHNDVENEWVIAESMCMNGFVRELSSRTTEGIGDTVFYSRIEDWS